MDVKEILEDKDLEKDSYIIIKLCLENNISIYGIAKYFIQLPFDIKINYINNWPFDYKLLYGVINLEVNPKIINKVFEKYVLDLEKIDFKRIVSQGVKAYIGSRVARNVSKNKLEEIHLNSSLITKEFAYKIFENNNPFDVRFLINNLQYITNVSKLESYLEKWENELIKSSISNNLLPIFQDILNKVIEHHKYNIDNNIIYLTAGKIMLEIEEIISKYGLKELQKNIKANLQKQDLPSIIKYIKEINDSWISNFIIDYHFKDNYFNVLIDMENLLYYIERGEFKIPKERLKIYKYILKIDTLSIEDKFKLHEELQRINIMELFYDDIYGAKRKLRVDIKNSCIDKSSIKKFYDQELSKKYGMPVYNVKDREFLALVKYGSKMLCPLPTGYSYSLIKDNHLTTASSFNNPDTFIYDTSILNPDQIVHIFPYDSYTDYSPFGLYDTPTDYVNIITPINEIFQNSSNYTEILLLEKGIKQTDIDKDIPRIEKLAVYCVDTISEDAIESAKQENLPLFLVNNSKQLSPKICDHHIPKDYLYFNNSLDLTKFENQRQIKKFIK